MTAEQFVTTLEAHCSAQQRELLRRYFKPGKPKRGADDVFLDVRMNKVWWEHRIALVSTLAFVRKGDLDDTFRLAEMLRYDEHDKVQTAVGWLLRDADKNDRARLIAFLDKYAATLPRVALRTAIEHLDKDQRVHYLGLRKQTAQR